MIFGSNWLNRTNLHRKRRSESTQVSIVPSKVEAPQKRLNVGTGHAWNRPERMTAP